MANFGIYGATGRVGKLLAEHLSKSTDHKLASVYIRKELEFSLPAQTLVTNELETFLKSSDVVVDFTSPKGTEALLEVALENPRALAIGTTGLEARQQNLLKEASNKMPILYATNMSLGVALLNKLVYLTSKSLPDFDIEIVEMHHRHKKDSPSGTALTLATSAAKAREIDLEEARVSGRNGFIGERKQGEIGVMALRGGDIVGEHTVGFFADGEYIKLSHTATNRATFALGAIKASNWLKDQPNGLYSIQDYFQL